jgi:hypothetical protein
MAKSIDESALGALIESQAVREVRSTRIDAAWGLEVRLGVSWHRVRSRRDPVRLWASLTALGRFCERTGIKSLQVEL